MVLLICRQILLASEVMVLIGIIMSFCFTPHYSIPQYVISALITFVFAEVLEGMYVCICSVPHLKALCIEKSKSIICYWFICHATTNIEQYRSESVLAFTSNVVEAFPRHLQWWTPLNRGWDFGPCNCRCHDYRSRLPRHGPPPKCHSSTTSCDLHSLHRCNTLHLQHALLKRHVYSLAAIQHWSLLNDSWVCIFVQAWFVNIQWSVFVTFIVFNQCIM